jgi:selenocysteine-specific elongation factor
LRQEIDGLLAPTVLAGAEIHEVSALTGEGIDRLAAALAAACERHRQPQVRGRFRLAVDRCFTLSGAGTVVTGTVFAGRVRKGDAVVVTPSGLEARVRGIHADDRPVEEGRVGQRCALNLVGPSVTKEAISRGDRITVAAGHTPTDRLDARLRLLPSEERAMALDAGPPSPCRGPRSRPRGPP